MSNSRKKKTVVKKSGIKKKTVKKISSVSGKVKKTVSTKKASVEGLKKQYLKEKNICRVTFTLSQKSVPSADKVNLVGEFNDWNSRANPMKKSRDGYFTITLDLKPGREYQYRYLTNDSQWENDSKADKHLPSPFGSMNSVVVL